MDLINAFQRDVAAYLEADECTAHVPVIREAPLIQPGDVPFQVQVEQLMAGQMEKAGRSGLGLIVFSPDGEPESNNAGGLVLSLNLTLRIVELSAVNHGPTGTGVSAEQLLLDVMETLKDWMHNGANVLTLGKFTQVPIEDKPDAWAWDVIVKKSATGQRPRPRTPTPDVSVTAGVATVISPAGAVAYTTQDGTLPTPANGQRYTAPFEIASGTRLRAMAYMPGCRGSQEAHCIA